MLEHSTRRFIDQMGRTVVVPQQPQRIISLVPSQTELLFDLGLEGAVVGRTRFCIHPAAQVADVPVVGGTKQFRFDVIDRLQPDLILGNKEENYREGIERLAAAYPVWMSDIATLSDALAMIRSVGQLVGRTTQAEALALAIAQQFAWLPTMPTPLRVGYVIWQRPLMVAGHGTFIHDLLTRCGLINAFAAVDSSRYPVVDPEQIRAAQVDLILLSTEPFPFTERHCQAFDAEFGAPTMLVDGEMFSWYGSRLLLAAGYLRDLVNRLAQRLAGNGV